MIDFERQPTDAPPRTSLSVWLGLLTALVVSTASLILAAGADRRTLGIATSPFGWNRVIVIYSFSTLILSCWIARMLASAKPTQGLSRMKVVWCVAGLGISGYTVLAGSVVGHVLAGSQVGLVPRTACCILWCVALQVPWLMLAGAAGSTTERLPPHPSSRGHLSTGKFSMGNLLMLGLVTAIGVPLSFLTVFLDEQTMQAYRYWQEMKIAKAQRVVQRLVDIGSARPLGQRESDGGFSQQGVYVTPRNALVDLQAGARFLEEQAQRLTSSELTDQNILELASCYTALDRLEEAVAVLEPISQRNVWATLSLAELYRQLGRNQDCQMSAERVLEMAQRAKPNEVTDVAENENLQFAAYEMLVVLAGERADYARAERLLKDAYERLPGRRADVDAGLTKHFEFIGDFSQAAIHRARAADANPQQYSAPEPLWRKVLSSGAPVGLARPKSSRYQ